MNSGPRSGEKQPNEPEFVGDPVAARPQSRPPASLNPDSPKPPASASRLRGLALIALLILLFTLIRFADRIPWGAR